MKQTQLQYNQSETMFSLPKGFLIANRYEIIKVIGSGGFSVIYQAADHLLGGAYVAIKEFFPSSFVERMPDRHTIEVREGQNKKQFEFGLSRFRDESKRIAAMQGLHNVMSILGTAEQNGTLYIIMEYLEGETLSSYLRSLPEGRFTDLKDAQTIILAVAEALEYCHRNKLIHRDVSCDNIFLCRDHSIKLIDFGSARSFSDKTDVSEMSVVIKPGCTPPEQYSRKGKQGPWTDIYALGAVYYRILTGAYPDPSPDRHYMGENALVLPSAVNPDVPEYLDMLVIRCLALQYTVRIQSAEEVQRILAEHRLVDAPAVVRKKQRVWRASMIGFVVTAAVLVLAIGLTIWVKTNTLAPCTLYICLTDSLSTPEGLARAEALFEEKFPGVDVILHFASETETGITYALSPADRLSGGRAGLLPKRLRSAVVAYDPTVIYVNNIKKLSRGDSSNLSDGSGEITERREVFLSEDAEQCLYRGHVYDYVPLLEELSLFLDAEADPENRGGAVVLTVTEPLPKAEKKAAERFLYEMTQTEMQEALFLAEPGMLPANEAVRESFFANIPRLAFLK